MNEDELREAFHFELALACILLKNTQWVHTFKRLKFTKAKLGKAHRNGTVQLSTTTYDGPAALRTTIRCFLTDLHSGFAKPHKFRWQRTAKILGLITECDADDIAECELCHNLTPLTKTKRCLTCKKVEEAVKLAPEIARKVLDRITPLEFTEEEKHELKE